MAVSECPKGEVQKALFKPPSPNAAGAVLEPALLKYVQDLAQRKEKWARGWRYSMEDEKMHACLFTEEANGEERWLLARMVVPAEGDAWSLVELKPTAAAASKAGKGHLLPLPKKSLTLAQRTDAGGAVCAELVKFSLGLDELRDYWTSKGWTVTGTDMAEGLTCQQDNKAVQVWGPGLVPGKEGVCFLIRLDP
jgi:hypothetical protein